MFNFTFLPIKLETNTEVVKPIHVTYSPHSLHTLRQDSIESQSRCPISRPPRLRSNIRG